MRSRVPVSSFFFLMASLLILQPGALAHATTRPGSSYVRLADGSKIRPTTRYTGPHPVSARMTVQLVLAPGHQADMDRLLAEMYDPTSPVYHRWLPKGEFGARFAPDSSGATAARRYLESEGLRIVPTGNPFLLRATGTTAQVERAFRTRIADFRAANGASFYANTEPAEVPAYLSQTVEGVMGLTSTSRTHPHYVRTGAASRQAQRLLPRALRAEGPAALARPGYGAGPGGSGLTPSQVTSIYGARGVYRAGSRGQGKTLAVFELSGYKRSDVYTYQHRFFGGLRNVPLVDVNVDGGPLHPRCPKGDVCARPPDYSGDIEVEADLEIQIAVAPRVNGILVYNAPNDYEGITVTDEYFQIARDDFADSVSSSWGLCEQDAGAGQLKAESIAFRQMALQGQSMFVASGDSGAYDCLLDTGSPSQYSLAVDDPASQPYVTAVGGTSFESYDPGSSQHPSYPSGYETVWNPLNLCDGSEAGLEFCSLFGASGGGNSRFWGRPGYQWGPGVNSSYSRVAPYCKFAALGRPCREVPDVSANADEFTPYAEYCTGVRSTNSTCASFASTQPVPGWFGIGGTSLSSPLWSAVIVLWDSYHGERYGAANFQLYRLLRSRYAYTRYFHDVTGVHQVENSNGYYPVRPAYDMGTGIGTPRITGIATSAR